MRRRIRVIRAPLGLPELRQFPIRMTREHVAAALGWSRSYVDQRMRAGDIPVMWQDGERWISRSMMEAWLHGRLVKTERGWRRI